MARGYKQRTHRENIAIVPRSAHGDAAGDKAFAVYALDADDSSATPVMTVTEAGNIAAKQFLRTTELVTSADAQNSTWTAAQLLGGFIVHDGKTGSGTATTCTGAELSAAIAGVAVGYSFTCVFYAKDQQATVTAGTSGITVLGTAAVPASKAATLHFICTAADTWSVYVVLSA